jgi:hypothetical protein
MRSTVYYGLETLHLAEVPEPPPGARQPRKTSHQHGHHLHPLRYALVNELAKTIAGYGCVDLLCIDEPGSVQLDSPRRRDAPPSPQRAKGNRQRRNRKKRT